MDINCYLVSNGEFKIAKIPENMLVDLCKNLRENGVTSVHFASRIVEVEGVYIPAKGCKNVLMVVPNRDE